MKWHKVTENMPPEGQDLLVWTGHYMIVASADYYSDESRKNYANLAIDSRMAFSEKEKLHLINCRGRFSEFGQNHYFDNPKVYWAELPAPPSDISLSVQEISKPQN